jgi:hypothetical protein
MEHEQSQLRLAASLPCPALPCPDESTDHTTRALTNAPSQQVPARHVCSSSRSQEEKNIDPHATLQNTVPYGESVCLFAYLIVFFFHNKLTNIILVITF